MKNIALFALFASLVTSSAFADQLACDMSQANRLNDEKMKQLTTQVCVHEQSSDPDIYMPYFKMLEEATAADFLVYEYTDSCYQQINKELLKSKDQDPKTLELAKQLDAVLCDSKEYKQEVFRGANLPEHIAEGYMTAPEVTFPAFPSSSKSFRIACEFAAKGNTIMKITSKSGRQIEELSMHPDEQEVLFRMNTRFKVLNAVSGFNAVAMSGCKGVSYYLELEEIN